jgi:hypothetical protein
LVAEERDDDGEDSENGQPALSPGEPSHRFGYAGLMAIADG